MPFTVDAARSRGTLNAANSGAMAKRPTKAAGYPQFSSSRTSGGRRGVDRERGEPARDLARAFQGAHEYGTRALHAGDLKSFSQAIAVERGLIDEQRARLEEQADAIKNWGEVIRGIRHPAKLKAHKAPRVDPRTPRSSTSEMLFAMLHTPPLPAEENAPQKRTTQMEGPSINGDLPLDDEHRQLLDEHHALEREHATFVGHPQDWEGHEAHRGKLRQHVRKLHAHVARIRQEKKADS